MLDILIIGGGIHGTHLAHCLLQHTPLTHDDIRILDPHEELLHEWWRCTRNCGMRYLRSPSVHQIDIHPFSLDKYARLPEHRQESNFIAPKDRPSVKLFRKHCSMVIDTHRLASLMIQGKALEVKNQLNHVGVVTEDETIDARMILLAVGMNNQPLWPPWAVALKEQGAPVHHVFDPSFDLNATRHRGPIAVVGSGISGAQVALNLVEKGIEDILLISRRAVQVSDFDFDPGWLGPKNLDDFSRQSLDEKRRRIAAARLKGSIPQEMKSLIDGATAREQIACIVDDITDASYQSGALLLRGRHGQYACQQVILATGFREAPPGDGLITQAIREFHLETAPCGFPVIGPSLRWHTRIFVSGPLSELQIGPSARNIAGARHSGRRITAAFNTESIPRKVS
jgi:glycine/D-amino acid oxidase-like deaminating enzyme